MQEIIDIFFLIDFINNKPQLAFYGESGDKGKGIRIRIRSVGGNCNLYEGSFDVEVHGVEMVNVGIKNDKGSTAIISDIETNSPIINTGGSFLKLERAKVFLNKKIKIKW